MFHNFPKFTLLLVAVLLLVACAPAVNPVADPQADPEPGLVADPAPEEETYSGGDVASETGTLVIYSGRSESLVGPIIQQFAEVSGIDVQVRYGSTSEMAAALLEEGANSPADVFFAQDPGGLGAVEAAGLLAELPEDILSKVDAFYASPNGRWVGISGRARVVVYNTERLQVSDLPDDLMGFTDTSWSGRLGIAPGNGSFQTMVTGMRQLWGEDETRAWLQAIADNNPTYYENNTSIVAAVAAGEVDAGLVNHYYLYRFLAEEGENFPARNHYLADGGPGSLLMVAGAGRLANGENEANALRFLNFLLSPVAQQYFASQTYEYPLVEGVATSSLLIPLTELNPPQIALGSLADLQGTVTLLQEVGMLP
ncbi:MAG: iron ABC transporter substrate-binding protein [Chloroflexi bacterium]|nr:iron ABC transporter substrate-binding protein [Chloroflexota bacterium]MQC26008.1 iron ABC transporter substrate-binding protein [Chloroflexota bacterium]